MYMYFVLIIIKHYNAPFPSDYDQKHATTDASQSYLLTFPKHSLMGRLFKCPWGFLFTFWRLRLGAYWSGDMLLICFCLTLASCFVFLNCSVSLIVFVRSVYWLVPRPFSRLSVEVATSSPGSSSAWPCRAQQGREDRGNEVVLVAA